MGERVYKELTLENRKKIQELLEAGVSITEIAKQVKVARSTVYLELQKCPKGQYDASKAHLKVKAAKRLSFENRQTIQRLWEENASVSEIADAVNVAKSTIYAELRRCPPDHYDALEAQCTLR